MTRHWNGNESGWYEHHCLKGGGDGAQLALGLSQAGMSTTV